MSFLDDPLREREADPPAALLRREPCREDLRPQLARHPGAVVGDAQPNDPPLRTDRPDVPVIQRLGTGMGEHRPPNPEQFDEMGRLRTDGPLSTQLADEKENKERQREADKAAKASS